MFSEWWWSSGAEANDSGVEIGQSLRFREGSAAALSRTMGSGNRKTYTISIWIKRGKMPSADQNHMWIWHQNPNITALVWQNNKLRFYNYNSSGTFNAQYLSTAVFRDPSAWYHVVAAIDTTIASPAGDRVKLWVNGERLTTFDTQTTFSQDYETFVGANGYTCLIGKYASGDTWQLGAYLADHYFIDGQALEPTAFGRENDDGVWVPREVDFTPATPGEPWDYRDYSGGGDPGNWDDMDVLATDRPNGSNADASTTESSVAIFSPNANLKRFEFMGDGSGDTRQVNVWTSTDGTTWTELDAITFEDLDNGHVTEGPYAVYQFENGDGWSATNYNVFASDFLWSGYVTTSTGGFQAGFGPDMLFDGNTANDCRTDTQSATVTWTPDDGFDYTTSVEVFIGSNSNTCNVSLNGTEELAQNVRGWNTVDTGAGTITSLAVGPSGGGGIFTGVEWGAIRVDGQILIDGVNNSYGVNGFHLDFSDPDDIGADRSGNGNDFTATGFELTDDDDSDYDLMQDSPTQNYATLNPLVRRSNNTAQVADFENANLTASTSNSDTAVSTFNFSTTTFTGGAYAVEAILDSVTTTAFFGVAEPMPFINDTGGWSAQYMNDGNIIIDQTTSSYGDAYQVGDLIRCEFDYDNGTVEFFLNGTSQGQVAAVPPQGVELAFIGQTPRAAGFTFNYGQQPYTNTPSSVFDALQTQNRPEVTILNGRDHFRASTGPGADILTDAQAVFDTGLWWIKDRTITTNAGTGDPDAAHRLVDSVRGDGVRLASDSNAAETTYAAPPNNSIAWCWNAGGAAVTNNDGSIESQVSANTVAGFSIVEWERGTNAVATIGHGLDSPPECIFSKAVVQENWSVYHVGAGNTGRLRLNSDAGFDTSNGGQYWDNTDPGDDVFTVGNGINTNATNDMIAYCWHSVPGYSAFGTYTGNGDADGPFVYLGFKPAFVLLKRRNNTGWWKIRDSTRNPVNPANTELYANTDNREDGQGTRAIDLLSNGFKLRTDSAAYNVDTGVFIYCAFAENPFQSPVTAR